MIKVIDQATKDTTSGRMINWRVFTHVTCRRSDLLILGTVQSCLGSFTCSQSIVRGTCHAISYHAEIAREGCMLTVQAVKVLRDRGIKRC